MQNPEYIDLTTRKASEVSRDCSLWSTIGEAYVQLWTCSGRSLAPLFITHVIVVAQYQRAIIMRLGKVIRRSPAGPGIIFILPVIDDITIVDLRTQSFNLDPQEILTKDSVTITVDAIVYFHVEQPLECFLNVVSHRTATTLLAVATLRNNLGQYALTDVLGNRVNISNEVKLGIAEVAANWGVIVERVELKEVILPQDLQKAMAAEAEGTRLAKAKIIEANGEIEAAHSLRDASKLIEQTPQIMLLRYLQTLNFVGASQNTTIFFPFPLNIPNPQGEM